jgi:hypothetical protein
MKQQGWQRRESLKMFRFVLLRLLFLLCFAFVALANHRDSDEKVIVELNWITQITCHWHELLIVTELNSSAKSREIWRLRLSVLFFGIAGSAVITVPQNLALLFDFDVAIHYVDRKRVAALQASRSPPTFSTKGN